MSVIFNRCKCYLSFNYFLPLLNSHIHFIDEKNFLNQYSQLISKNKLSEEEIGICLRQLVDERDRRESFVANSLKRKQLISAQYQPVHSSIFELQERYLDKSFVRLVENANLPETTTESLSSMMSAIKGKRLYTFPVFTEDFCTKLVEEIENYENSDLPKGRPTTMNHYGISLEELGFYENFITPFRENYLEPLAKVLFPDWTGKGLDSHKAFIVVYKMNQDLDLATHFDNAEVTLNVALGKDFEEGSLYHGRMRNEPRSDTDYVEMKHKRGYGLMHRGQQLHGAMPIEEGERYNLIIWLRSSSVRNKLCPMCDREPDLEPVPVGHFGDGFTQKGTVDVCTIN